MTVFSCDEVRVRSSMGYNRPYDDLEIVAFRGQKSTGTWVIKANEFKFEVKSDLRGHLEAVMASEGTIVAILGNMHIYARVIEVACIKSEVKFEFGGH